MAFTRPALPYAFDALEPHIDAATMRVHSEKHHQAYVDNLNKALDGHPEPCNPVPGASRGRARVRPALAQGAERGGALLRQYQAVPAGRHAMC